VVIDGFPRSANTFAAIAFQLAQPEPVRLGHHLHVPAHLIAAATSGVPALALIRDPIDAAVSEAIREGPIRAATVLSAYIRFYGALLPYLDDLTIGPFDAVTNDLGSVIARLNARSGTGFALFEHTPERVELAFRLIEERERRPDVKIVDHYLAGELALDDVLARFDDLETRGAAIVRVERSVSRPSAARAAHREALLRELGAPGFQEPLRRAHSIFDRIRREASSR
jgi:hypothetical protein